MVESTALEMRHTRKGIEGSNPSLSASQDLLNNFNELSWVTRDSNPQHKSLISFALLSSRLRVPGPVFVAAVANSQRFGFAA